MIVGLKYVGASDDLPTRIPVGDVVDLWRESCQPSAAGAVAAYYDGMKVGYLSSEKQALWDSLSASTRGQAKVIGEILDEDGDLAGLDIEIDVSPDLDEKPAAVQSTAAPKRGITHRSTIGLAVFLLTVIAGAEGTGPTVPTVSSVAPHSLAVADHSPAMNVAELVEYRDRNLRLAQVVKLTPPDQVSFVAYSPRSLQPGESADRTGEQAHELNRIVQQASVHRLAMDLKQRAEVTRLLQQAEMRKTQQLAEDLRQALEAAAQQRIRFEELERQAWQMALRWQAENRRLKGDHARLQRRIEEMELAAQLREEDERKELALQELNQEELERHKNKMTAWTTSVNRAAPITEVEKTKSALRQVPKEAIRAALTESTDKLKRRRKTNFSRYAQESRKVE